MSVPSPTRAHLTAVLALVFNALVWGLSWWPFRELQAQGLHPLWATAFIYAGTAVLVAAVRPGALRELLSRPALWWIVLAAGGTNAAFNWGVSIGEVMRVVLLFYLMPLWTVLLARWLLNEPITAAALGRVVLAIGGAALVLGAAPAHAPADGRVVVHGWLPDLLGVVGGLCFAVNNVMLRRQRAASGEARALAMFTGGAVVASTLAALSAAGQVAGPVVPWPPGVAWAWLLPVAVLSLVFLASNLSLQHGATRLPANVTAVVMLAEVPFAALSSAWWGGEVMGPALWAGGALIVAAAVMAARRGD
jgi:drug/metabolite transporter (DMT)-like permease